MARRKTAPPTEEWDTSAAPPTSVKTSRNAGRQFTAPTKKSQLVEKQEQRRAEAEQQTRVATRRRANWERSKAGRQRMGDIVDYATEEHNRMVRERPELGLTPTHRLNVSPGQLYRHYGFSEDKVGPTHYDVQLPGMGDPHALPRPKRWEEFTDKERAGIAMTVKKKSGATPESMERSFGAQLDQGYIRARQVGANRPYAQDFYHGDAPEGPAERLRTTSRRHNVPMGLVAATNADTSPNMKFRYTSKEGVTSYPNAEQAEHAIAQVRSGKPPSRVTKKGLSGMAATGFHGNFAKAVRRAHQVIRGGKTVPETYATGGSKSGFGPKTAAYHNAWLTGTPQFLVSDVHTGGGGMLPHLSSDKPLQRTETGEVKLRKSGHEARSKSEREKVIATGDVTGGFHAMADYAARQAMQKRGLAHIPQAQATQWGEETIRRHEQAKAIGEHRAASGFPSQERAYPPVAHPVQFKGHIEHQQRLF